MILPRLQHGWEVAQDMRQAIRQSPREQAAHFYFDTLVYHPAALEFLITTYGASRLLVGSDYPFLIQQRNPKGFLDSAQLAPDAAQAIGLDNARRFVLGEIAI